MNTFKRFPWYVFLAASFPALALGANNISQVPAEAIVRSVVFSILFASLAFIVCRLVLRDAHRAALMVVLLLGLFFIYGHIYEIGKSILVNGIYPIRHRSLGLFWGGLGLAGLFYSIRNKWGTPSLTLSMNLVATLLVLMPLSQIITFEISNGAPSVPGPPVEQVSHADPSSSDIYYIILDGYGRSDLLKRNFDFDNSQFLNDLRALGFYVAACSQSNYSITGLSLTSSLNYDYIETLIPGILQRSKPSYGELGFLIQNSRLRKFLEEHGYRTVAFSTGYRFSEITNADDYYESLQIRLLPSEFETLFLRTTLMRIPIDLGVINASSSDVDLARLRMVNALDQLPKLAQVPGPKFVFVHLLAVHGPFFFGPNGEVVDHYSDIEKIKQLDASLGQAYRDQGIYVGKRVVAAVKTLLQDSTHPPIIIIQGDHGPRFNTDAAETMQILNAYYLPDAEDELYPTITPVNSFRIILNSYFDAGLPLLEDSSYYSGNTQKLQFEKIPNNCIP